MTGGPRFDGFSREALAFLAGLAANNERGWFAENKEDYQRFVREPMRWLVAELAPAMLSIDAGFDVDPRGIAVSRIHRDIRFSRDKSPYRANQWIAFRHRDRDWPSRPAFFLEFRPDGYRYGMGYYAATPATMRAVRARIGARTARFLDALASAHDAGFSLAGEPYRRVRVPEGIPAEVQQWHRLKSAYMVRNRPIDNTFFSRELAGEVERGFTAAAPLYAFLAEAAGQP